MAGSRGAEQNTIKPNTMARNRLLIALIAVILPCMAPAQIKNSIKTNSEDEIIRRNVQYLTDTGMHGRGYVRNGKENASQFIQNKFKDYKMRGITKDGSYVQSYVFPVNTFPGKMSLTINKTELVPGEDFIIDPSSLSFSGEQLKIETVDLTEVVDTASWLAFAAKLTTDKVYYFDDITPVCKVLGIKNDLFPYILPKGCYIINGKEKLTWSVKPDTCHSTIFYVKESSLPNKLKYATVNVESVFIPRQKNENVIGFLPGKVTDSFIVFTAHYDHLGMMGSETTFPGASDNASGTAMMLYLAYYFTTHPHKYSLLFIAFSGEEADLLGSRFYVKHPVVPLGKMKFLINLDIMGDATDGVTVVNATEFPDQFSILQRLNNKNHYIPTIKSRGKAANSDHYPFTEAGVPSFFIYSNGGPGYYHDVYDQAKKLSLTNISGTAKLLVDFTKVLNDESFILR